MHPDEKDLYCHRDLNHTTNGRGCRLRTNSTQEIDLLKQIEAKRAELAALEKRILEPSEEDRATYADFLRQPDTGLMRILPRENYERIRCQSGCAAAVLTTLSLNATTNTRTTSDISLEQGQLRSGFAGANYGMLTTLGDIPLENVSLETGAAQILASHTPAY